MNSLYHHSWYRVAELKPRIRSHAKIQRHRYRGQIWYVLQDLLTDTTLRFSPAAYYLIGLMDGRLTVQEIWDCAHARFKDEAPTQGELIQVLSQLHESNLLESDIPPNTFELQRRIDRAHGWKRLVGFLNPMALRIPILDPERILRAIFPFVRFLFGWIGVVLWLAVVLPAVVLAAMYWPDLSRNVLDRILTNRNLVLMWLVFPLIKLFHEFGHALSVKSYGGEVHEMGVMFLVFTPIPYVDASSANAFRHKWRRVMVGAAGLIVELFIAALAMYVWVMAEPGWVHSIAFNVMLVASISTVLFNANPLLRYDGYYILSDLIEVPNLRTRAGGYLSYLFQRYVLGRKDANPPVATTGEKAWFVPYAVASFLYRFVIMFGIMFFVMGKFFWAGVFMGVTGLISMLVFPVCKGIRFVFRDPGLREVRRRAIVVTGGIAVLGLLLLLAVPVPLRTRAEGVVWLPDESIVRARTNGFVDRVVVHSRTPVREGDLLIVMRDVALSAEVYKLEAREAELLARLRELEIKNRPNAEIVKEDLKYIRGQVKRFREVKASLRIHSLSKGVFIVPLEENLPGKFVRKGEVLAYVVDFGDVRVNAAVSQKDIDLVRHRTRGIEIRLAENITPVYRVGIQRIVPTTMNELPSAALGVGGGGRIAVDPTENGGQKAIQRFFQVDLRLPPVLRASRLGGRVYILFDHGYEPFALQVFRALRQVFLARFNV